MRRSRVRLLDELGGINDQRELDGHIDLDDLSKLDGQIGLDDHSELDGQIGLDDHSKLDKRIGLDHPNEFNRPTMLSGQSKGNTPFVAPSWFVGYTSRPVAYEAKEPIVRFVKGREYNCFTEDSKTYLTSQPFRISPHSDRMGYRLQGEALHLIEPVELISEAVSFGTVQVPPEGNPIILMADRQTVGGYPKMAQIVSADLPVLAQVKPGESVRFAEITFEQAEQLYMDAEFSFMHLVNMIGLYLAKS
ncbi:hypothetical protein KIK04_00380 [Paenibacillus sp. 481]|nr:hypothetical protein KIK04_00380 [Paenibacillus sp. 481]